MKWTYLQIIVLILVAYVNLNIQTKHTLVNETDKLDVD